MTAARVSRSVPPASCVFPVGYSELGVLEPQHSALQCKALSDSAESGAQRVRGRWVAKSAMSLGVPNATPLKRCWGNALPSDDFVLPMSILCLT